MLAQSGVLWGQYESSEAGADPPWLEGPTCKKHPKIRNFCGAILALHNLASTFWAPQLASTFQVQ